MSFAVPPRLPAPTSNSRQVDGVATGVGAERAEEPELARALSLTSRIYDVALDPSVWPDALRELTEFVGGAASAIFSHDVAARQGRFYFTWGDDPHYTRLYLEKYVRLNPVIAHMMLFQVGEVCTASDIISTEVRLVNFVNVTFRRL